MTDSAAAKLAAGLAHIEPLLQQHGFVRVGDETGKGSGGPFASATFAKGDRRLHLWLRVESLSVRYRLGDQELDHGSLMRELLGPGGPNQFPAYAENADVAFAALGHDLERFCTDFLDGTGDEFRRCVAAAVHDAQLTGAQRLARVEQQLKRD